MSNTISIFHMAGVFLGSPLGAWGLLDIVPGGGGSGSDGDWGGINGDMQNLYMNMYYLCLALAGIFGLVGGYKIYAEWQLHSRHHLHITAHIAAWTGAAIFFVLAAAFISLALL